VVQNAGELSLLSAHDEHDT
jgi:selenocysteine lyase/cysteine desulfurase